VCFGERNREERLGRRWDVKGFSFIKDVRKGKERRGWGKGGGCIYNVYYI